MHNIQQPKTIFPSSGFSKRAFTHFVRLYGKTLDKTPARIRPTNSADLRILVHSMGGIGNTLMATPMLQALRELYPAAQIDLLTSPGAATLLKHSNHVSRIIADDSISSEDFATYLRVQQCLVRAKYDAALLTLNACTIRLAARCTLARIGLRVCHKYEFRPEDDINDLYTNLVIRRDGAHDVVCNMDLLESLSGMSTTPGKMLIPLSDKDRAQAEAVTEKMNWQNGACTIGVSPGSSGWMSFKRWPTEKYIELVKLLLNNRPDIQICVLSGPDEALEMAQWREQLTSPRVIYAPHESIRTFAAIIEKINVLVSNDSLPMHIAAALQVPVVALFGPTDSTKTGPWSCPRRIVTPGDDSQPYFTLPYPADPSQFPDLMSRISVKEVLESIESLMTK